MLFDYPWVKSGILIIVVIIMYLLFERQLRRSDSTKGHILSTFISYS